MSAGQKACRRSRQPRLLSRSQVIGERKKVLYLRLHAIIDWLRHLPRSESAHDEFSGLFGYEQEKRNNREDEEYETMVVDGVWGTIGSTNFDNRSTYDVLSYQDPED
jgi:hypothetical protein